MTTESPKNKLMVALAMLIFGTTGLLSKYVPLPSSFISMIRGLVGALCILMFLKIKGQKLSWDKIKACAPLLIISGIILSLNWVLLFEAFKYTSIATATVCYYLAPVLMIMASPFLLKETLSHKKLICVMISLTGLVIVSGVLNRGALRPGEIKGILLGLFDAVLYAAYVIITKKLTTVPALERTCMQLAIAGIVLIPYNLLTTDVQGIQLGPMAIIMLFMICAVNTGLAYSLYYTSFQNLRAQTAAIYSYIDPIVAILCSALILQEPISTASWIGAALVLGGTIASEV